MILIFLSQLVNFRSAQVVCCCSDVSKTKLLLQLVNAGRFCHICPIQFNSILPTNMHSDWNKASVNMAKSVLTGRVQVGRTATVETAHQRINSTLSTFWCQKHKQQSWCVKWMVLGTQLSEYGGIIYTYFSSKKLSPISISHLTQGSEANTVKSYNAAVPNCMLLWVK